MLIHFNAGCYPFYGGWQPANKRRHRNKLVLHCVATVRGDANEGNSVHGAHIFCDDVVTMNCLTKLIISTALNHIPTYKNSQYLVIPQLLMSIHCNLCTHTSMQTPYMLHTFVLKQLNCLMKQITHKIKLCFHTGKM